MKNLIKLSTIGITFLLFFYAVNTTLATSPNLPIYEYVVDQKTLPPNVEIEHPFNKIINYGSITLIFTPNTKDAYPGKVKLVSGKVFTWDNDKNIWLEPNEHITNKTYSAPDEILLDNLIAGYSNLSSSTFSTSTSGEFEIPAKFGEKNIIIKGTFSFSPSLNIDSIPTKKNNFLIPILMGLLIGICAIYFLYKKNKI